MKRSDFLKKLSAPGFSLLLSFKKPAPSGKDFLLKFHVRGFRYYQGPGLLNVLQKGNRLKLVREPQNHFDAHAVALYFDSKKIGFVPAEKNEVIARLLEHNPGSLQAEILEVNKTNPPWESVLTGIYLNAQRAA